jgi:hypothetical protein
LTSTLKRHNVCVLYKVANEGIKMNKWLWIALAGFVALPIVANAEVYKWKDKDGAVRYSDTPPPSNVQQLPVSGQKATPVKPAGSATPPDTAAAPASKAATAEEKKKKDGGTEGEAMKRQQKAEEDKKASEQKDAELKARQQNCTTSKANLLNYQHGGRIYKMNEKGEREYESDAGIAQNLEQAKKDVAQYCD